MKARALAYSILFHLLSLTIPLGVKTIPSVTKNNELKTQKVLKVKLKERLIVETEKVKNKEKPKDSKFLSESNQTVDTETISNKKKKKKKSINLSDLAVNNISKVGDKGFKKSKETLESEDLSYLDNIPLGDFTKVNSIEYKHFGFFSRMRKPMDYNWGKTVEEVFVRLYKYKNIKLSTCIIKALIILDAGGNLLSTKILELEGSERCVPVVITTIEKSAPFKNPPKDLIYEGKVRIKWIFTVR